MVRQNPHFYDLRGRAKVGQWWCWSYHASWCEGSQRCDFLLLPGVQLFVEMKMMMYDVWCIIIATIYYDAWWCMMMQLYEWQLSTSLLTSVTRIWIVVRSMRPLCCARRLNLEKPLCIWHSPTQSTSLQALWIFKVLKRSFPSFFAQNFCKTSKNSLPWEATGANNAQRFVWRPSPVSHWRTVSEQETWCHSVAVVQC